MITAGIDIGSVATKAVIISDGKVLGKAVVKSQTDHIANAETVLSESISKAGISRGDIRSVAVTGYGRRSIGYGDKIITEISAGAAGAYFLGAPWGKPRLVADLGGQDTKVILLDNDGGIVDFRMNDKCAAGTGRFIEVMAGVLGVSLDKMGEMSLKSKNPAVINATCTVFAESEVISLIAGRTPNEDIIAGLHNSVASRIVTMIRYMGDSDLLFIGGGASNKGVCKAVKDLLGKEVYVPSDPQFAVALGAALLAE